MYRSSIFLINKYPQEKIIFCFSVLYFSFFSLLLRYIFSENMDVFGEDALLFHNIAIQLRHFMETGSFDSSLITNGKNILYEYCPASKESLEKHKFFILYQYIYQIPAVLSSVLYFIFKTNEPFLVNFTNILIQSASTTLMYLFFYRTLKDRWSSLFAVLIVGFFPINFFIVVPASKGIYYYFGFSFFCFALTTQRKFLFLFFSLAVFVICRPAYFFNFTHDEFCNLLSFNFQKISDISFMDSIYSKLDNTMNSLIKIRNKKSIISCNSNFDYLMLPKNGQEIIEYMPKGFFIGLFKPYPTEWFNLNKGFLFFVSSIEMFFIYIGLFLTPFSLWHWKKHKNLWIISVVCLFIITVYGTLSYNLGYLYRVRFVFIGTLSGIGLMYLSVLLPILTGYITDIKSYLLKRNAYY